MEEKIQRYWFTFITKTILLSLYISVYSCQKLNQGKDYKITRIVVKASPYDQGISSVDTIFVSKSKPPETYSIVGAKYIWDGKGNFVNQIVINYDLGVKPNIVFNMAFPFYMDSYKTDITDFEKKVKSIVRQKFSTIIYFENNTSERLFPNNETEIVINDYYPPAPPLEE